jgi:hypothetical protein
VGIPARALVPVVRMAWWGWAWGQVPFYRVYALGDDGHVVGPPTLINCDDDEAATREAQRILKNRVLEVWSLTRIVARLDPPRKNSA